MDVTFRHLAEVSLSELCDTFNLAFSDYIVPLKLTTSLLEQKLKGENIDLSLSAGAFSEGRLVGFMLHGVDDKDAPRMLYNGGTGVVPAARGQHLVQRMYDYFLPGYRTQHIGQVLLEVIKGNEPAIRAYSNTGFEKVRFFHCYKGTPLIERKQEAVTVLREEAPDWALLASWAAQQPSWSNSIDAIRREGPGTITWIAWLEDKPVGFISVFRDAQRIRQIAVDPGLRRRRIGSSLLERVREELGGPFSLINVDDRNEGLKIFLEQSGLAPAAQQYEMVLQC